MNKSHSSNFSTHPGPLQKLRELKIFEANISKVVRTTRNDFVFGTSNGIYFFKMKDQYNMEPTNEPIQLEGKDVTEISEFSHDRFVIGLWNENDFLMIDRNRLGMQPEKLIEPLWCNNLCTDLVPIPGYHPVTFPFYLSKTLRSISIIDFRTKKVYTLLETQDMPTDCYGYKKMTLATTIDGRLKLIFVSSENQNTVVQEVSFARYFMKALKTIGMQGYLAEASGKAGTGKDAQIRRGSASIY